MRIYRDIATLAGAQVVCFLLLSHLEPAFFLLHFYQTIIYLAILIMLFLHGGSLGLHDWNRGSSRVAGDDLCDWLA